MRNFPVNLGGKEYWISRSCAVVGILLKRDDEKGKVSVLANKRGPGCPDFVGKWNVPCGYVDYNETLEEAVSREVFEETGLKISPSEWELNSINSDPKDSNRQNITVRFISLYNGTSEFDTSNSEKGEVDDVRWIELNDIDNYEWAFEQYRLLKDIKDCI